jgi:hypothetical protein
MQCTRIKLSKANGIASRGWRSSDDGILEGTGCYPQISNEVACPYFGQCHLTIRHSIGHYLSTYHLWLGLTGLSEMNLNLCCQTVIAATVRTISARPPQGRTLRRED